MHKDVLTTREVNMEYIEVYTHEYWLVGEVKRSMEKVDSGESEFISNEEANAIIKVKLDNLKTSKEEK